MVSCVNYSVVWLCYALNKLMRSLASFKLRTTSADLCHYKGCSKLGCLVSCTMPLNDFFDFCSTNYKPLPYRTWWLSCSQSMNGWTTSLNRGSLKFESQFKNISSKFFSWSFSLFKYFSFPYCYVSLLLAFGMRLEREIVEGAGYADVKSEIHNKQSKLFESLIKEFFSVSNALGSFKDSLTRNGHQAIEALCTSAVVRSGLVTFGSQRPKGKKSSPELDLCPETQLLAETTEGLTSGMQKEPHRCFRLFHNVTTFHNLGSKSHNPFAHTRSVQNSV